MMAGDAEFEVFAALLRRGRDVPEMVQDLAEQLERALPSHVEISRGGLRRRVRELTIRFNPEQFRIEVHGHRPVPLIDHVVRGVCVRTEEAEFDDWLDRLAKALAEEATKSTEVRLALEDGLQ
jgi:hypothetical protein